MPRGPRASRLMRRPTVHEAGSRARDYTRREPPAQPLKCAAAPADVQTVRRSGRVSAGIHFENCVIQGQADARWRTPSANGSPRTTLLRLTAAGRPVRSLPAASSDRQRGHGGGVHRRQSRSGLVEGFERTFVIKRIRPDRSDSPKFVQMFCDEARISRAAPPPEHRAGLRLRADRRRVLHGDGVPARQAIWRR